MVQFIEFFLWFLSLELIVLPHGSLYINGLRMQ